MRDRGPGLLGTDYYAPFIHRWSPNFGGSSSPWPSGFQPGPLDDLLHRDEITPIACYIVNEMNTNAHSPFVKLLAKLNSFPPDDCIDDFNRLTPQERLLAGIEPPCTTATMELSYHALAMFLWAMKVKPEADWDHKDEIKARFPSSVSASNKKHLYGDRLYSHEIWSNIHYGYIGMAAGFSESVLIKGAGVAHTIGELKHSGLSKKSLDIIHEKLGKDLRSLDDSKDKAAIKLGIGLYRTKPKQVTTKDVMDRVYFSPISLGTQPYRPWLDRYGY